MRYKQGRAYAPSAYKNDAEYFADVAKVYQAELQDLYDAGLRNVQFDDPGLAYFCSNKFREGWAQDKDNIGTVDDLLDAYIKLYNDSIAKVPADMHTGKLDHGALQACAACLPLNFDRRAFVSRQLHWRTSLRGRWIRYYRLKVVP